MRNLFAALALAVLPSLAGAQTCLTCIQNSASPQNAQFNVSSATIRGILTVGTLNISTVSASTVTAGVFIGSGTSLTNLNASQLLFGTVSTSVVSGQYFGITGVGTLSTGTWKGNIVGTQWGGTGLNTIAVSTGSLLYFSGNGTMATLSPGDPQGLLQTNGSAAPVWTSSPAVSGANLYGILLTALKAGDLPTNIIVSSNSIPYVAGASVIGNISGSAGSYTGTVQLSQLSTGTLPSTVVASSITVTGVTAGTYGSGTYAPQIVVGTDGRLTSATQLPIFVGASSVTAGTFPSGVVVPLANLQAGTLPTTVVASSITATGVTPGTYGGGNYAAQVTVRSDGRVSAASQFAIPGVSTATAYNDIDNAWSHAQTSFSSWTFVNVPVGITGPLGNLSVAGNAFSVGGSTFVVAGGSATVAYGFTATDVTATGNLRTGSYVNFPNGSYLTQTAMYAPGNFNLDYYNAGVKSALFMDGSSGAIGIGTANPTASLEVLNNLGSGTLKAIISSGTAPGDTTGIYTQNSAPTGYAAFSLNDEQGIAAANLFRSGSASPYPGIWMETTGTEPLYFATNGLNVRMKIDSTGNVTIGSGSGTAIYYCNGGTQDMTLYRGNSGAGPTLCTGGGGTLTATPLLLP